jgi:hypothetical protein
MDRRRAFETVLVSASLVAAMTSGCAGSSKDDQPESPAKQSAASEKTNPDSGAAQNGGDTAAACSWNAKLDRGDDAPRGACHAKRHLLSCTVGGATEICLSDEAQCTDADESACEDKCKPNEYAIACGAVGPDTGNPDPPAACHGAINTPGGTFYMCCPCE